VRWNQGRHISCEPLGWTMCVSPVIVGVFTDLSSRDLLENQPREFRGFIADSSASAICGDSKRCIWRKGHNQWLIGQTRQ
jgi:hypothetical protein